MEQDKTREYHLSVIEENKKLLAHTRRIYAHVLQVLEREIEAEDEKQRDNAITALNRVTAILLKLIPLELEVTATGISNLSAEDAEALAERSTPPEVDHDLVSHYLQKYAHYSATDGSDKKG